MLVNTLQVVYIGEIVTSDNPDETLVAYGLGSCVAVCLYDPIAKVGGMLHALLPTAPRGSKATDRPAKFVDRGVPMLTHLLQEMGARQYRMVAKLCGGAQLLSDPAQGPAFSQNGRLNVGKLNVLAADVALRTAGLPIKGRATGGTVGRTVRLHMADGRVTVKTLAHGERVLW
ncbi:MAG: chemotaxis protein CheD [Anaerolineae bacterium]|jgi:chemotaxis protein CheD